MGVMYVTGDGVEKDYGKARTLYEQAAQLGVAHAYRELAAMAVNGEGTAVDVVKARVLYLQSIELGEPDNPAIRQVIESRMDPAQIKLSSEQFEQWKAQRKD
jgi:TPR repeat protein